MRVAATPEAFVAFKGPLDWVGVLTEPKSIGCFRVRLPRWAGMLLCNIQGAAFERKEIIWTNRFVR